MSNGTITILNTTPYNLQPVPEVGKEYHAFDDGKIKPSRLEIVKIVELIPFDKADEELLKEWKQNVEECYWLYALETDYFAKAEYEDETSYFVRTEDGGWFSMGWFGSRLDIDGSLYNKMNEWYKEN